MKTNRLLFVVAAGGLLMTACSKRESRMLTIVREDGTCSREISYHVSEQGLMTKRDEPLKNENFNLPADWERSWSVVGEDSVRHPAPMTQSQIDSLKRTYPNESIRYRVMLHARRQFDSVGEMSDSLTQAIQMLFKAESRLEKRFKWFYTYYTFQETFSCPDPSRYFPVPMDEFLGADSAAYWFTGQPNMALGLSGAEQKELLDRIEPKVSLWLSTNFLAYIYRTIGEDYYDDVQNPPVSRERFLALQDSFLSMPAIRHPENVNLLNTGQEVSALLRDFYHSDAYTPILEDSTFLEGSIVNRHNGYMLLTMIDFDYDLVMPGKVLDIGIGTVRGDVISYRLTGERLIPGAYTIAATSRVTNVWAFVVMLIILLLAVASFVFGKAR